MLPNVGFEAGHSATVVLKIQIEHIGNKIETGLELRAYQFWYAYECPSTCVCISTMSSPERGEVSSSAHCLHLFEYRASLPTMAMYFIV
jgi:hypothetical protein